MSQDPIPTWKHDGVRVVPGAHHHGPLESLIYVLKGRARMRWGERLEFNASRTETAMRGALLAAVLAWPAFGAAQTLYRCGNTYSQVPCASDAASVRVPVNAAPDTAPGTSGKELCATEGVSQLRFPEPESTRVGAVTKAGAEAIPYAGKHVATRKYHLHINAKNTAGLYTGERVYVCYLSEDERRVLKVDTLRP